MFVRFTPRQVQKVRELLKTSKLHGYDVKTYQEILKALNNPIDERECHQNILRSQQCDRGPSRMDESKTTLTVTERPVEDGVPAAKLGNSVSVAVTEPQNLPDLQPEISIDSQVQEPVPEEFVESQNSVDSKEQISGQYVPGDGQYVEEPASGALQSLKEKLNLANTFSSPVVEERQPSRPHLNPDGLIESTPTTDQLEEAGVFGVIDNRTNN